MKRLALAAAALLCGCNPNLTTVDSNFHPLQRGWGSTEPVWRDEFNGASVDPGKWVSANYCGGYNGELQCYRPQNITFDGANMIITARPETCSGDPGSAINEVGTVTCPGFATHGFTSARIHTRISAQAAHKWTYGRVEIRAKLPYGNGTWPAFWMLPTPETYGGWPRSGEIDILEAVNLNNPSVGTNEVQSNIHVCSIGSPADPNASPNAIAACNALDVAGYDYYKSHYPMIRQLQTFKGVPNLTGGFHTYAMEWSDNDMRFFVDDEMIGRLLHGKDGNNYAPFQQPFYLIINLAVGGAMPGTPATGTWAAGPKAELVVDWVRVYACVADPTARNCIYNGAGLGTTP
jgi:beta-glucanase (GH16 family)